MASCPKYIYVMCRGLAQNDIFEIAIPHLIGSYTASSNSSNPISASVAVPAPTNAMDGSNRDCGYWYKVCHRVFIVSSRSQCQNGRSTVFGLSPNE